MLIPLPDALALALFIAAWLAYEHVLKALGRGRGHINTDMTVIRTAWMRGMAHRENRFMDGQLMGHALNSASFFASSNLILIAAVAGVVFGGPQTWKAIQGLALLDTASRLMFEIKMTLVLVCLARGLLDFIWAIRQMNYCLAAIGAAPELSAPKAMLDAWGEASARLLNPALSAFNAGVRGYYFALAAAAWLLGPVAMAAATVGAVALLVWRQRRSPAAGAVGTLRALLEERDV
ncbi:MAG: hypothetical protein JWP35_1615 [Caulobacter sp.]|nr:hypothetical protein [Caulobacter sp.]